MTSAATIPRTQGTFPPPAPTPIRTPEPPKPPAPKKSNRGRKTEAERIRRKAEAEREQRRLDQERKRAPRIQPDTRVSLGIALGIAGIALATSFTVSYSMIAATAEWMKLPWEPLAFIVPGFVELLTIFAALDYIITRSRGENARAPFWAMWVLSGVAVIGGTAHTISEWGSDWGVVWESVVGTVFAAVAPLVVIYVSKRVSSLVFVNAEVD